MVPRLNHHGHASTCTEPSVTHLRSRVTHRTGAVHVWQMPASHQHGLAAWTKHSAAANARWLDAEETSSRPVPSDRFSTLPGGVTLRLRLKQRLSERITRCLCLHRRRLRHERGPRPVRCPLRSGRRGPRGTGSIRLDRLVGSRHRRDPFRLCSSYVGAVVLCPHSPRASAFLDLSTTRYGVLWKQGEDQEIRRPSDPTRRLST